MTLDEAHLMSRRRHRLLFSRRAIKALAHTGNVKAVSDGPDFKLSSRRRFHLSLNLSTSA